jgi:hypothetical protein
MIFNLIKGQAGSLSKAVLENIMNSIDALAKAVFIVIDRHKIIIVDDGHGFRSREEIEQCFEVFGFPHEENQRTYGQFGIGRAQLWAFSSAVWKTNQFVMDVDIKRRGLDWDLLEDEPSVKGLTITSTFYEPLSTHDILVFTEELKELALFAQIPVFVNGEQINMDPKAMKWDFETDDAYIKLNDKSQLYVYNLGVLVRGYSSYQLGSGGVVVTKPGVGLAVNMARNDILVAECKVWKRIRPYIQNKSDEKVQRKATTKLSSSELENRAKRFLGGELTYRDVKDFKFIMDITNRSHTLEQFFSQERGVHRNRIVTTAQPGSTLGERAHTSKLAFVMHPETLSQFGLDSLEQFRDVLFKAMAPYESEAGWKYGSFKNNSEFESDLNKAVPSLNEGYEVLPAKDWTKQEKAVLSALGRIDYQMRLVVQKVSGEGAVPKQRQYAVGVSDTAAGWTDGKSRIVFTRELLAEANSGIGGFMKITSVMLHEYLHDDVSTGTHIHEETFYQRHHDAYIFTVAPHLVFPAYRSYVQYLATYSIKPTTKLLEHLTLVENILAQEESDTVPQANLLAA